MIARLIQSISYNIGLFWFKAFFIALISLKILTIGEITHTIRKALQTDTLLDVHVHPVGCLTLYISYRIIKYGSLETVIQKYYCIRLLRASSVIIFNELVF